MPRLQFGLSSFERARGDLPELPVINFFVEEAPTEQTGVVLQSRPGLAESGITMGAGPVRALFQGDGALSNAVFGVSNKSLYSGSTLLGSVDGAGPFFMDSYSDRLFIAGGGKLWTYAGALVPVAFPDDAPVTKVIVAASRAIALRQDTDKFYWTEPLGSVIDALAFATAENQPDRVLDVLFIDGVLIPFGAETVEFWPATTDADLPFQPLPGRVFEKGIKATGCASEFGSSFAWVTNTNQVCLSEPDNVISKPGMEALIGAAATVRLQRIYLEGTEFLWLRMDSGDWLYSARSRLWSELVSYDETSWKPGAATLRYFGSSTDGRVLQWGDGHEDLGGVLERRFRAGHPLTSGNFRVNNLVLRLNVGQTPYLTGDYSEPTIEMRLSRNAGETWSAWMSRSLGVQGSYRKRVEWRSLGQFGQPGILAEFRCTAPVPLRISDVIVNEPMASR